MDSHLHATLHLSFCIWLLKVMLFAYAHYWLQQKVCSLFLNVRGLLKGDHVISKLQQAEAVMYGDSWFGHIAFKYDKCRWLFQHDITDTFSTCLQTSLTGWDSSQLPWHFPKVSTNRQFCHFLKGVYWTTSCCVNSSYIQLALLRKQKCEETSLCREEPGVGHPLAMSLHGVTCPRPDSGRLSLTPMGSTWQSGHCSLTTWWVTTKGLWELEARAP